MKFSLFLYKKKNVFQMPIYSNQLDKKQWYIYQIYLSQHDRLEIENCDFYSLAN